MSFMKQVTDKIKMYEWYYLIVILGYVLTLVSGVIHPGIIATVLLLAVSAELLMGRKITMQGTLDYLMIAYIAYNILSGFWTVSHGIPFSVFAGEASTTAIPMIFYFAGRSAAENLDVFYKKYILAVGIVCTVGLILYIWAPEFYLNYLFDHTYISEAKVSTMRIRMISVIGSTLVGYLSVAAMLASSHILVNSGGKKGKLLLFINCFFAFMSNQRSAMVVAILVLVYVNFLVFFTFRLIRLKYFFLECGLLFAGFAALCLIYFDAVMKVYYRLVSLPGAIGQRSDQWVGAINNMANIWIGNGLGANGHRAVGFSQHIIADGGLAKIFCEMGILGTSIFIFMMILLFKNGIKSMGKCCAELGIIGITLLQSIGSNILAFQLATPIFWFAVGRCAAVIIKESKEK